MRAKLTGWFLVGLATISVGITATQTPADSTAGSQPTAVSVLFFVDDARGDPMQGLTQADVSILDNKKPPQSVVAFGTARDLPLRLGLLIDTSTSQRSGELYRPGVKAASDFLNQVLNGPDNKVFIVSFAAVANGTAFMDSSELLKFKINLTPGGGTAFYDAINLACRERMMTDSTQPARRVLIALTDGEDNLSHVSLAETIAVAQRAGAAVFSVSTNANLGQTVDQRGNRILRRIAEETGGIAFDDIGSKDMPKVFAKIKTQIDTMYRVTYIPGEVGHPGHYRSLELKAVTNKKLKVRGPRTYYVPAQQQ
jgi:Ca-activated chloride channel family protein